MFQFLKSYFLKSNTNYNLHRQFFGHTEPINTIAISHEGKWLASGGLDGVRFWSMATGSQVGKLHYAQSLRGQPSSCVWVFQNGINHLLYGTAAGYIVTCAFDSFHNQFHEVRCQPVVNMEGWNFEVTCIAFHQSSGRVITGTRDGYVQAWLFVDGDLQRLWHVSISGTVPKSFAFTDNTMLDLYAFGIYDGRWHLMKGTDGTILETKGLGKPIGPAAVCVKDSRFAVDNGLDGFDWHDLNNGAHLKTFGTGPLKEKYPRQVRLVEGGRVIVGGGENGRVYLFDTHSGGSLGTLRHDTDHLIQTINTHETAMNYIIAAASSTHCDRPRISVWIANKAQNNTQVEARPRINFITALDAIAKVLLIAVALSMLFPNTLPVFVSTTRPWFRSIPGSKQPQGWIAHKPAQHQVPDARVQYTENKATMVQVRDIIEEFVHQALRNSAVNEEKTLKVTHVKKSDKEGSKSDRKSKADRDRPRVIFL